MSFTDDYDLRPVDYVPAFAGNPMDDPTQAMVQGQSEGMGNAVSGAIHSYMDQPSWVDQAAELERQRQADPAGDWDRRIQFASGMVGPSALTTEGAMAKGASFLNDVRRPRENIDTVLESNFNHGREVGNDTARVADLNSGISASDTDTNKVQKLVRQMSGPEGYWERPIVDDAGNVVEGQHRIAAAKKLGLDEVPVYRVKDLERGLPTDQMRQAINAAQQTHPDHVHGIMSQVLDMIHESGSPQQALMDYQLPQGFESRFRAALNAAAPQAKGIRAYHGTRSAEQIRTSGGIQASKSGEFGPGVYLGQDPGTADFFASNVARGPEGPSIIPVNHKLENPFYTTKQEWLEMLGGNKTPRQLQDKLKKQGYDGIVAEGLGGGGRQVVVFDPEKVTPSLTREQPKGIRAYHGSPYDFERFDLSKIGTGEGAQAYGHGIYLAEHPATAESYRAAGPAGNVPPPVYEAPSDALARNAEDFGKFAVSNPAFIKGFGSADVESRGAMVPMVRGLLQDPQIGKAVVRLLPVDVMHMLGGKELTPEALLHNPSMLVDLLPAHANDLVASRVKAADILAPYVARATAERPLIGTESRSLLQEALAARGADKGDLHVRSEVPYPSRVGNMYEVNINADPEHFLDWDKPLSEQSEHVQNALQHSAPTQGSSHTLAGDAKSLSDFVQGPSFSNQGYSGLDAPSRRVVMKRMVAMVNDPEIRKSVVGLVPADVMHVLSGEKAATESGLHNATMLFDKLSKVGGGSVPLGVDRASSSIIAIANAAAEKLGISGDVVGRPLKGLSALPAGQNHLGSDIYRVLGSDEDAAKALRDQGISGIKYLDQGSRGSGTGTSNYVVFDDKLIDIIKKYGLAGLIGGGGAHFATKAVNYDPFKGEQKKDGMASGGAVKSTKAAVHYHYRDSEPNHRCGVCRMFRAPAACTAVQGVIGLWDRCDLFEPKKGTK